MVTIDWYVILFALLFIIFDFVSGIIKAAYQHDIHSAKMREGLFHKSAFILVIILGILCENAFTFVHADIQPPIVIPVCTYIIFTEIASILENIMAVNPELKANKLFRLFRVSKEEEEG